MKMLIHLAQAKQAEYIIALIGLFSFIIFWRVLNGPKVVKESIRETVRPIIDRITGFLIPGDVLFHPGHAWARVEGDDMVTVGMDDFAAKLLGSVDSMSLPKEGSRVKQGSFGWLMKAESRAIHMLSPVEGEVVAVNREVIDSPALAFDDPYGKGWLFKVRNDNLIPNLKNMVPASMVGEWFENIRETLARRQSAPAAAGLCQDGGEPVPGLARAIDPQGWDDLAREFLLTK
jgi:glycine cleavage system H lipoate-binding protein